MTDLTGGKELAGERGWVTGSSQITELVWCAINRQRLIESGVQRVSVQTNMPHGHLWISLFGPAQHLVLLAGSETR